MNKNNDRGAAAKVQKTTNSDKSRARAVSSKVNQGASSSRDNPVNSLTNISMATSSVTDTATASGLLPPARNLRVTPDSSSAMRMWAREEVIWVIVTVAVVLFCFETIIRIIIICLGLDTNAILNLLFGSLCSFRLYAVTLKFTKVVTC